MPGSQAPRSAISSRGAISFTTKSENVEINTIRYIVTPMQQVGANPAGGRVLAGVHRVLGP